MGIINSNISPYRLLGVRHDASVKEINKAHRKFNKENIRDRARRREGNEARNQLRDPQRRFVNDLFCFEVVAPFDPGALAEMSDEERRPPIDIPMLLSLSDPLDCPQDLSFLDEQPEVEPPKFEPVDMSTFGERPKVRYREDE